MRGSDILVIEDDCQAAALICKALTLQGHRVTTVTDGRSGLLHASAKPWDLLVVDRMLPGYDGLAVVKSLRKARVEVPVLFLTALDGIDDRVDGLRAGGDDYLVKPFAIAELSARVDVLIRRCPAPWRKSRLKLADLSLDRRTHDVTRAGRLIELTPLEFNILVFLMLHAGQVITHKMLLENVWHYDFDPGTTIVASHISRLRVKIDREFSMNLLHTVRGVGYQLGVDAI
ncbi:MAG: DNA-binding response regulator [Acidocella sp. 20-61-6]|nr:MAG: DNA-binding response regulator [Acidocella sp. 20-61-6]